MPHAPTGVFTATLQPHGATHRGAGSPGATRSPNSPPTSMRRPPDSLRSSARFDDPRAAGTPASGPAAEWLTWRVRGLAPGLRLVEGAFRVARAPSGRLPARDGRPWSVDRWSYAQGPCSDPRGDPGRPRPDCSRVARAGHRRFTWSASWQGWRQGRPAERGLARLPARHAGRSLHIYPDADGTLVLRGRLAPEVGRADAACARRGPRDALPAPPAPERSFPRLSIPPRTLRPGRSKQGGCSWPCWPRQRFVTSSTRVPPQRRYQVVVHVDAAVPRGSGSGPGRSALEDGPGAFPRGNVATAGLRCEPGVVMRHDEGRAGWWKVGARNADDSRPALRRALQPSGPELPLPGVAPFRVG